MSGSRVVGADLVAKKPQDWESQDLVWCLAAAAQNQRFLFKQLEILMWAHCKAIEKHPHPPPTLRLMNNHK